MNQPRKIPQSPALFSLFSTGKGDFTCASSSDYSAIKPSNLRSTTPLSDYPRSALFVPVSRSSQEADQFLNLPLPLSSSFSSRPRYLYFQVANLLGHSSHKFRVAPEYSAKLPQPRFPAPRFARVSFPQSFPLMLFFFFNSQIFQACGQEKAVSASPPFREKNPTFLFVSSPCPQNPLSRLPQVWLFHSTFSIT